MPYERLALSGMLLLYWVLLWIALLLKTNHLKVAVHATVSLLGVIWLALVPPDMTEFMINHVRSYFTAIACAVIFAFGPLCGIFGILYRHSELFRSIIKKQDEPKYSSWPWFVLWLFTFCIVCLGAIGPIFLMALGCLWHLPK